MIIKEVTQDAAGLGGLAVYVLVTIIFFLLGNMKVAAELVIALALLYLVIASIRAVFFKKRPDSQKHSGFFTKIDASSFPSMHSARSLTLAVMLATVFTQNTIRILLAIAVLGVSYARIRLKRHYASDVIGGLVIGALISWLAIKLVPFFI
jgi:membrane-associated phospholipid phosphatase